jgi:uncharacterized protein
MSDVMPTPTRGFHVMTKPVGPMCNLDCRYCFYLEKENLFDHDRDLNAFRMPDDVLESFIKQHIESQEVPEIQFAWQGGEPTLLGVDFFEKVVELEEKYANGKTIHNAFQTNGILINDSWGEFLAKNNFLVGLSIDGPKEIHNQYRVDKGGKPSFNKVMRGLEMLKKHEVEFNTLTCVQRHNATKPLEVYKFLREVGSGFMQFIPIIERKTPEPGEDGLTLVTPDEADAAVMPWSVRPKEFGTFLSTIFDEWVRHDVAQVFVQIFDTALEAWLGMNPSLCVFRDVCGDGMALEHNGDLYSCDHYVYPEYKLGNIMETPLGDMANSKFQRKFGTDKRDTLPGYCQQCLYHFMCHGECPKHRFLKTPDGEPGLNYLCEGYQHFFAHIDPYMQFMANELRYQRPPANVMQWVAQQDMEAKGKATPGANDPCICGSGKKYKKCCGKTS